MIKIDNDLVIICREVDGYTNRIAVYKVTELADDRLISRLNIRTRFNTGLRYFAVPQVRWNSAWQKDYMDVLGRPVVTEEDLKKIGGIVEI